MPLVSSHMEADITVTFGIGVVEQVTHNALDLMALGGTLRPH